MRPVEFSFIKISEQLMLTKLSPTPHEQQVVALVERLLSLAPINQVNALKVFTATLDYDDRFSGYTIKIVEPSYILTFRIDNEDAQIFAGKDYAAGG